MSRLIYLKIFRWIMDIDCKKTTHYRDNKMLKKIIKFVRKEKIKKPILIFKVGKNEKHIIELFFSKISGVLQIRVDGELKVADLLFWNVTSIFKYKIEIGKKEKHEIVIELIRPFILSPLRSWEINIYIRDIDG